MDRSGGATRLRGIPGRWDGGAIGAVALAFVAFALVASSFTASPVSGQSLPNPQKRAPTGDWRKDNIYYGAVPPGSDSKPVLVFVHGLFGVPDDWWSARFGQLNDMYLLAYGRGYRTAFVALNRNGQRVDNAENNGPWENGYTLKVQIEEIARVYNVPKVVVVAHSKGGVDTEAAIVAGAASQVKTVFTLGAPHQGAEIADLVVNDPRTRDLFTQVFGAPPDESVQTLGTLPMQYFRAVVDASPATRQVQWYTAAGTDWGPTLSLLYRSTGPWLSQFGASDGLVTVRSTRLPNAKRLFVEPFSHTTINVGRYSFPWIDAVLRRGG